MKDDEEPRTPPKRPEDWTLKEKLAAVMETASVPDSDLGTWLRRKGFKEEHLRRWRETLTESSTAVFALREARVDAESQPSPSSRPRRVGLTSRSPHGFESWLGRASQHGGIQRAGNVSLRDRAARKGEPVRWNPESWKRFAPRSRDTKVMLTWTRIAGSLLSARRRHRREQRPPFVNEPPGEQQR